MSDIIRFTIATSMIVSENDYAKMMNAGFKSHDEFNHTTEVVLFGPITAPVTNEALIVATSVGAKIDWDSSLVKGLMDIIDREGYIATAVYQHDHFTQEVISETNKKFSDAEVFYNQAKSHRDYMFTEHIKSDLQATLDSMLKDPEHW